MYIPLNNRALIKVAGPDARDFLQGLISQDTHRVSATHAVYAALLSPQGKFQVDFFCFEMDGALILECEESLAASLIKRLSMYKLRSDVELSNISADFQVFAVLNASSALGFIDQDRGEAKPLASGIIFIDPRISSMGCRIVLKKDDNALPNLGLSPGDFQDYEHQRMTTGIADGSRDMTINKALLLENGFEELDGVSFNKGCFMGQELTARTRYRGLVKKRLLPVTIDGTPPPCGSILMSGSHEVGEMKSSQGDVGLALVRLDQLANDVTFHYGNTTLTPSVPDWVVFQGQDHT